MTDDLTTISITKAQKAELDDRKEHDRESYKSVLSRLLASEHGAQTDSTDDVSEQLDRIESAALTAEERTNAIQNTLEELQR